MKLSLSLLKNYVDIDTLTPIEISDILTLAGIEVDGIDNETPSFSNVVSAVVEETKKHPDADKLQIATVYDGENRYQVVCGAPNCKTGLKTAFARCDAYLTDENDKQFKIKKCKLRGIESFGMLCSKKELNISEDGDGIIELPDEMALGIDLSKTLVDPIFDISLTPNLGHCMSAMGVARELAALTNKKLKYPENTIDTDKSLSTIKSIKINTEDKANCPRYAALLVNNIEVAPSPYWLQNYLEGCSIRSINNIVDVMNFVMIEMGQPLHGFDYDKIEGQSINICSLKQEENFLGLDGISRKLPKNALVIQDSEKTIAVAGVMGGDNSAVTEGTKNILIEAAFFNSLSIRKTSRAINLRSESSLRFEKMTDPNAPLIALNRAAHLLKQLYPSCHIAKDFIDIKDQEYNNLAVNCRVSRVNKIIGTKLSVNEVINIFNRLEIKTKKISDDTIEASIPTFRNDLKKEIDLIEEVARIYGYNNIERKPPIITTSSTNNSPLYDFETLMKRILIEQGMQELITCDLIGPKLSKLVEEPSMQEGDLIKVLHAKSAEQSILRSSHLPSFLQVVKHNHDHKNFDICAFEIGKVHFKKDDELIEQSTAALVISGKNRPYHFKEKAENADFYDIKGIIENVLHSLKIPNWSVKKSSHPSFHPERQANVFIGDIDVGVMGEVHPKILDEIDIKKTVLFAELNNLSLLKNYRESNRYIPMPQFPSSDRDWTITTNNDGDISSVINKIRSPILEKIFILDIYSDPKKASNEKNITLRFIYRDKTKTISFEEVEKTHLKITNEISQNMKD